MSTEDGSGSGKNWFSLFSTDPAKFIDGVRKGEVAFPTDPAEQLAIEILLEQVGGGLDPSVDGFCETVTTCASICALKRCRTTVLRRMFVPGDSRARIHMAFSHAALVTALAQEIYCNGNEFVSALTFKKSYGLLLFVTQDQGSPEFMITGKDFDEMLDMIHNEKKNKTCPYNSHALNNVYTILSDTLGKVEKGEISESLENVITDTYRYLSKSLKKRTSEKKTSPDSYKEN
jgi:hypothetical protein